MGLWTWGNHFIPWAKNPWRTVAFNYEPWPFLLWFFPPFFKITIFIPHLLVKAKGSAFSLSQVCCRRQGAEQGPCPAHLLHTCTHQRWAGGARAGGKATNRKNFQIYGCLDLLLLLAILCLARKANLLKSSHLWMWGVCRDGIPKSSFPQTCPFPGCWPFLCLQGAEHSSQTNPDPAGELQLCALPTQLQPVPHSHRMSKDLVLIPNKTDCFANEIN